MAGESLVRDAATELTGKAIVWGPAIAGALLLGPAGVLLGLAASVAIAVNATGRTPSGDDRDDCRYGSY
jgi:hypothetical protein